NLPAPADTSTLSLHDALPIYVGEGPHDLEFRRRPEEHDEAEEHPIGHDRLDAKHLLHVSFTVVAPAEQGGEREQREPEGDDPVRSEEHTSELQSRFDLVCRLL